MRGAWNDRYYIAATDSRLVCTSRQLKLFLKRKYWQKDRKTGVSDIEAFFRGEQVSPLIDV